MGLFGKDVPKTAESLETLTVRIDAVTRANKQLFMVSNNPPRLISSPAYQGASTVTLKDLTHIDQENIQKSKII